jgi:hypothetical protein
MIESFMESFVDVDRIFFSTKDKVFDHMVKYSATWVWMKYLMQKKYWMKIFRFEIYL